MDDIIKFRKDSKHKDTYLKKLKNTDKKVEESNTYILKTDIHLIKVGYTSNSDKFLSLSSGLIIMEGNTINDTKIIIKSIDYDKNFGYIITLIE